MELAFVLLLLVVVLLFFALVVIISFICYKKNQNKENEKNRIEEKQLVNLRKKSASDSFTIPIISVPQQIPFDVKQNSVQENLPIDAETTYTPSPSNPLPKFSFGKKRRRQKKKLLSRSKSCPNVGPVIAEEQDDLEAEDEEEDDEGNASDGSASSQPTTTWTQPSWTQNVLQQTPIFENDRPLHRSEGNLSLPSNPNLTKYNFKKSTRDVLEAPRKISVYQDATMDVTQLTLARRRGSSLIQEESFKKVGMIHFSTEYLEQERIFQVCVKEVTNLTTGNLITQYNPFVRLYLSSDRKCKHDTKVLNNTRYPVFNEYFEFRNIDQEALSDQKLRIKLYTQDVIKRKQLLGQVDILLSSLSFIGIETFDVFLFKKRSTVSMTSVCLTLCHQATKSRLDVFVDRLRKVPKPPKGSISSSIYGSCTLYKGNNEWKRNTSIKAYQKDPIFEEDLVFQDLSTSSSSPLSSFSLMFSLVERSLLGHDKILGQILLSDGSPQGSGAKHWGNVHEKPHIKHTSWHYLLDPDEFI